MVLPAVMVLSSCSMGPKAEKIMIEDTEAHEEFFGEAPEAGRLGVRKLNRAASDLVKPKIGVQYRSYNDGGTDYLAVRYVAAVASLNVTATWYKAVVTNAGGEDISFSHIETTTAYAAVNDNNVLTQPSDYGAEYNYLVVYTLRKIPVGKASDYMMAYLTISDGTNSVSSDAAVTKVADNSNSFSFNASKDGFFLAGTFGGNAGTLDADGTTKGDGNAASFTVDLEQNDSFVVIQKTNSVFKIWDGNCYKGSTTYSEKDGNYVKAKSNGNYLFYLNGSNEIWPDGDLPVFTRTSKGVYVRGDAAGGWNSGYESFEFVTDRDNKGVLFNVALKVGDFKIADSNYSHEWNYTQCKDGGDYWSPNSGNTICIGGAKDNFEAGSGSNIHCKVAGTYNIYLTNNWYVSFELIA